MTPMPAEVVITPPRPVIVTSQHSAVGHLAFSSRLQVASQSYFYPVSHISLRDWLRGLPPPHPTPRRLRRLVPTQNFWLRPWY